MSSSDSFIHEVTREVQRDRMFRLWRRYGAYVIAATALVVMVGALLAWRESEAEKRARGEMEEYLAIVGDEVDEEAADALEGFAARAGKGYALLAHFRAASARFDAGENEEAGMLYQQIVDDQSLPAVFRDLAALKAALVTSEGKTLAERIDSLRLLAEGDSIYRLLVQELLAGALLESGDNQAAAELFEMLSEDPNVSSLMHSRIRPLQEIARARLNHAGS